MLSGEKSLAMFVDETGSQDPDEIADFAQYVADGTLVRCDKVYQPAGEAQAARFTYFARAGHEWRIQAMHEINERIFVHGEVITPHTEREIGRLLGYSDADINQYLEWIAGIGRGKR